MPLAHQHFLIVADIEGSSGCWEPRAAKFLTPEWARACRAMTLDVNSAVVALLDAGAATVIVHDFHRTGYNLLPEYLDPRIVLKQGYCRKPMPGFGNPEPAQAALFLGLHGASGTKAFLPHTLTSRIAQLKVNGRSLSELDLFAAALAPFGIRPIFFTGCPKACRQARQAIPGIATFTLDKNQPQCRFNSHQWRTDLAQAARASAYSQSPQPHRPRGPFHARLLWRPGPLSARKIAHRWDMVRRGSELILDAQDMKTLYRRLIDICYLTPAINRLMPLSLWAYHLLGRFGQWWVRHQIRMAP